MTQLNGEKNQGRNKLSGLDHLRTLAIILVFVYHYGYLFPHPEWTNRIGKFGWTGVDLFFVLSGYLIASQLFAGIIKGYPIPLRIFFLKRFFRIIPAYLVVVTIYFLFPALREREGLAPIWKYLTFTQNIGLDLSTQGAFSHAWSLCIEEQFYLCMPLILMALVFFKIINKGYVLLVCFFASGFLIRLFCWHHFVAPYEGEDGSWKNWIKWIYYPTFCRLDGLLFGVSIAALFQFRRGLRKNLENYGNLFLLAGLLVLIAAYFLCLNEESFQASIFGFPLVDLGYGLVVISAISCKSLLYKSESKWTAYLARLSYSTYLVHKLIIHITQKQFERLDIKADSNLMLLVCIITTFSAAWIMNWLVEKPFLKWRDNLLRRDKTARNGNPNPVLDR
jgi:peptidoglycan/LPS O-acetylase OafA/YrhL